MKNIQLAVLVNILNTIHTPDDIDLGFKIADVSEAYTAEHEKFSKLKKAFALNDEEKEYGLELDAIYNSDKSNSEKNQEINKLKNNSKPEIVLTVAKKKEDLLELLKSDTRELFRPPSLLDKDLKKLIKMKCLSHLKVGDLSVFRFIVKK